MPIIHRSKEWYQARIGKFTASSFGKLMAKPANASERWSKSLLSCVNRAVAQEHSGQYDERPDSASTRWGIDHEAAAIQAFAEQQGANTTDVGFLLHPILEDVGATPDAKVFHPKAPQKHILAEVKCPYNQKIHRKYREKVHDTISLRKTKSAYFWQIQGALWVTGADYCYFISFDPRISNDSGLHFAKIERDQSAIEQLRSRVLEAIAMKKLFLEEVRMGRRKLESKEAKGFKRFMIGQYF